MAAEFKYELLPVEEQRAAVDARLLVLERDHLALSLDVAQHGEDGANPAAVARVEEIEQTIKDLRALAKKLS
jgi:hypothetical protein